MRKVNIEIILLQMETWRKWFWSPEFPTAWIAFNLGTKYKALIWLQYRRKGILNSEVLKLYLMFQGEKFGANIVKDGQGLKFTRLMLLTEQ